MLPGVDQVLALFVKGICCGLDRVLSGFADMLDFVVDTFRSVLACSVDGLEARGVLGAC